MRPMVEWPGYRSLVRCQPVLAQVGWGESPGVARANDHPRVIQPPIPTHQNIAQPQLMHAPPTGCRFTPSPHRSAIMTSGRCGDAGRGGGRFFLCIGGIRKQGVSLAPAVPSPGRRRLGVAEPLSRQTGAVERTGTAASQDGHGSSPVHGASRQRRRGSASYFADYRLRRRSLAGAASPT